MITYTGSCHCRAVQFTVQAPADLTVWRCNCSVCMMKQNHHFIVPEAHFSLLAGQDSLTDYRFNTGQAKHLFCKVCGVQAFYRPRSNPDGYAVTIYCVNRPEGTTVTYKDYDGQNWEQEYAGNEEIKTMSKEESYR